MSFEFDLSHELFLDLVDFMRDAPEYRFSPTFSPSFNAADFLYLCTNYNLGAKFVVDPVVGVSLIFRWNCENFAINYYCGYHDQIMDILSKVEPFYPVDSVISFRTHGMRVVEVRPNEGRIGYNGRRMYQFKDYHKQIQLHFDSSYQESPSLITYYHFGPLRRVCTLYIDTTSTEAIICLQGLFGLEKSGEPIRLVQEKAVISILKANKWIQ